LRNKILAAKLSAFTLFLSAVISGQAIGATENSTYGRDWSRVSSDRSEDVATSSNGAIVYNLSSPNIYRSGDYGTTWVNVTNQYRPGADVDKRNIAVSGDGSVIVITEYCGFAWISKDSGASWELIDQGYNCWIEPLVSQNGQRIMLYAGSYIFISDDYGSTFSPSRIPWGWESWTSSMSESGETILVIFNYGSETKVYMSQDYGVSFSRAIIPELVFPGGVAVSGDGRYLIASDYVLGGVWVSRDAAASWTKAIVTSENSFDYLGPQFAISYDGSRIVQSNYRGSILVSDDYGATFSERNQVDPQFGPWRNAKMSSSGLTIYNSSDAGVYKSVFTDQSFGLSNSGTVSFYLQDCGAFTGATTSIAAASVELVKDPLTAAANSDGATYLYFTETDTALWGATYDYGVERDLACQYSALTGSVVITRSQFISSVPSYSETTTNTTDFIQYVGGSHDLSGYRGSGCGNLTVPHATYVTQSCSSGILADYQQLSQFNIAKWRDDSLATGIQGQRSGSAYTVVKMKKSIINAAPTGASWAATETFTLTSV
jgi:hypothetical protein